MNAILGLAPPDPAIASSRPNNGSFATPIRQPRGPIVTYSRADLLRLSKRTQVPDGLVPLESWFGQMPKPMVDDPAIAAISPRGMRAGPQSGFGEGFGFGGGIGGGGRLAGGRGGVRNIGLRRQPEGAPADPAIAEHGGRFGGQMGKFAVQPRRFDDKRGGGERGERMGGDRHHQHQHSQHGQHGMRDNQRRDDDWRRGGEYRHLRHITDRSDRPQQRNGDSRRTGGPRYDDDSAEPAWMNDGPELDDPAIASSTQDADYLVKFVPGEDMIAAHKRQMKGGPRGGSEGDSWRPNEKPLVSFFGGEQPATKTPPKPKEVNVANYFKHKVFDDDKDKEDDQPEEKEETSAFQSRFQRFFGSGSQNPAAAPAGISPGRSPVAPESPASGQRVDDHMAKLMGMLSTKGPSPAPRPGSADLQQRPPFGGFRGGPPPPPGMYAQSPTEPPHSAHSHSQSSTDYMRRDEPQQPQYSSPPPPDPRYYGNFRSPMGELPQQPPHPAHHQQRSFYDGPQRQMPPPGSNGGPGPDLLSLLNQHGGPQHQHPGQGPPSGPGGPGGPPMPPPGMGMLPPHPMMQGMYPGGPQRGPGPSPDELLRNLQGGPGGPGGPPGFMRPPNGLSPPPGPQTPGGGPGGPPAHGGPGGPGGPPGYPMGYLPPQGPQGFYGRPPMYGQSPPPGAQYGNQHSQDMLAALMRH